MKKRLALLVLLALTASGCCCYRSAGDRGCCGYQSCNKISGCDNSTGAQQRSGKPCCPTPAANQQVAPKVQ